MAFFSSPPNFLRKKSPPPYFFRKKKSSPPCRWSRPGYPINFDPSLRARIKKVWSLTTLSLPGARMFVLNFDPYFLKSSPDPYSKYTIQMILLVYVSVKKNFRVLRLQISLKPRCSYNMFRPTVLFMRATKELL